LEYPSHGGDGPPERRWPGWAPLALGLVLYVLAVAIATYPVVLTFGSALPGGSPIDSLQHLWLMRWYKSCLLAGRLPLICPDVQYPVGAPLGLYSPTNYQSLLYVLLSILIDNDILCFNIIWLQAFLLTGMGTFLLIWYVLRDRVCATVGGLLALLSAPMLMHAGGHLELIHVGWFPIFLIAWLRFVDRPSRGRLLAAAGLYVLVAMSSPYFSLFAVFPAILYVLGQLASACRRRDWVWCQARGPWLLAFAGLAGASLPLIFSGQIWAMLHGLDVSTTRSEFERYGAPLWTYWTPTGAHLFCQMLPADLYRVAHLSGESISYLGIVTLAFVSYAAVYGVRFPRSRYWWAAFALLVVLSLGASWHFGGMYKVGLPSAWLRRYVFAFRVIRVPARFNLFAAVIAALLAAAGLRDFLASLRHRWVRGLVTAGLVAVAVFDLAVIPYGRSPIPPLPAGYAFLKQRDPGAALLEVPQLGSGGCSYLNAVCGYWQSIHHLKTTAAYTARANTAFEHLMLYNSPFLINRLLDRNYLTDPDSVACDLLSGINFLDYTWLYMTHHKLDYLVLHQNRSMLPEAPEVRLDRLKALLSGAKIFEDEQMVIYDRKRLRPPTRPILLCTEGWRQRGSWRGRFNCVVGKTAKVAVYDPRSDQDLVLGLEAEAFRSARSVRVLADGREIARWNILPDSLRIYATGPFRLPGGLHELIIESDGEERPIHSREEAEKGNRRPYSLRAAGIVLKPALAEPAADNQAADPPQRASSLFSGIAP
jgi:hypothetical protein